MVGIGNAVQHGNRSGESSYEKEAINKLREENSSYANNKAWTSASAAGSQAKQHNWLSEEFGNMGGAFNTMWANLTGKSNIERNKAFFDWAKDSGAFGTGDNATLNALAYYYLLDEVDSLASIPGLTRKDLKQFVKEGYFRKWDMQSRIDRLVKAGWHPEDIDHKKATGKNTIDRYLKAGLDWVPRDNYRALLHKGEMVLNAQEADYYRQMFPYGGESDASPRPKGRIVTGLPWRMSAGYPSYPSGGQHRGLDFAIPIGTKVGAAMGGTVVTAFTGNNYNTYKQGKKVFGQYVLVKGNNGLYYRYGHLSRVGVRAGQQIMPGDTIGLSGNTGYSTGPHLHFQVQKSTANNSDISPYNYVTSALFQAKGDINMGNDTQQSNNTIASGQSTIPIRTTKFIPKALQFATEGGIGGMEESVSKGVNSGIDRLIGYLDGIRSEQNDQRRILEAFSKSRMSEQTY